MPAASSSDRESASLSFPSSLVSCAWRSMVTRTDRRPLYPNRLPGGCSHLGVGPAALPQARSHSRVPRPHQSELGPHPISRHPSSQALPRNGDPLLRSLLGLQRAHRPEQRPSRFLKTVLDVTSYSSSFQSLSIGPLHVPHGLLRVPGLLDLPAPGAETGETEKLLCPLLCLFTALHPPGSKNV